MLDMGMILDRCYARLEPRLDSQGVEFRKFETLLPFVHKYWLRHFLAHIPPFHFEVIAT